MTISKFRAPVNNIINNLASSIKRFILHVTRLEPPTLLTMVSLILLIVVALYTSFIIQIDSTVSTILMSVIYFLLVITTIWQLIGYFRRKDYPEVIPTTMSNFVCDRCGKQFQNQQDLAYHRQFESRGAVA
jgi:hypothetical protein